MLRVVAMGLVAGMAMSVGCVAGDEPPGAGHTVADRVYLEAMPRRGEFMRRIHVRDPADGVLERVDEVSTSRPEWSVVASSTEPPTATSAPGPGDIETITLEFADGSLLVFSATLEPVPLEYRLESVQVRRR